MYIVLELEIKTDFTGVLEYVNDEIYGTYPDEETARVAMEDFATETLNRGYFDRIEARGENYIKLYNGGTVRKLYKVRKIS